jgi:Predicted Zn-dependent hydrolases of the beta-lactamase fold
MIEANGLTIFFNGDSGYCNCPKQIGELFPNIDIAIISIGAYHSPMMMKNLHTNPYEAVQIFNDLKAKSFVPMHYGTFDLVDEPMGEPLRILLANEADGGINGQLLAIIPGDELLL